MHVMKVGDMMEAKRKKGSPAQGEETREMKRDHLKQNWRESRNGKTLCFGILALMLVASVLSNFAAFHFKEALPCNLYLYLAISNIVLFITHQSLSVYFHPETVSLATSPVPPLVPHSWRGRIGRQLMLGFEFLTNKLGVTVLCAQLGFILHLFLLSPAEGRLEMSVLDPKLGRPLPEKDYGNSCDNLSQVYDSLYDFFVFVHFTGFMLMAGCMRSFAMPFAVGVFDELIELSLQHIFPNFRECWWDHFLADIFGANLLGCLTGYLITQVTDVQPFTWLAPVPVNEPSPKPRLRLFPSPFFSKVYDLFFGSDKRPLFFLAIIFFQRTVGFVIPFAFKYVMWVPVPHIIFIWHGVCQFGLQLRLYAELYQDLASTYADEQHAQHHNNGKDRTPTKGSTTTTTKRISNSDMGIWRYQWRIINVAVLGLEAGFIVKTLLLAYSNLTPPTEILAIWLFIVIAIAFCLAFSFDKRPKSSRSSSAVKRKMP